MTLARFLMMLRTVRRLGVGQVGRVALYRLKMRLGVLRRRLPLGEAYAGPFLNEVDTARVGKVEHLAFSRTPVALPPAAGWHASFRGGAAFGDPQEHWSRIPDFDATVGDIKLVWECSRFDWLPRAAWLHASGAPSAANPAEIDAIISDWVRANPVNAGPNWKCAQETGLRLINFITARRILGETTVAPAAAIRFVTEHVERILPSLGYAIGQDNNHAISETVALMIAGEWLERHGVSSATSRKAVDKGRQLTERLAVRLFLPDGVFAQYSLIYHRMALTLCSLAELERRSIGARVFSEEFYARMKAATQWLVTLTDPDHGDAPNFGANDGTHLLNLFGAAYRDMRPAVDLAAAVFLGHTYFSGHPLFNLYGVEAAPMALEPRTFLRCPYGGLDIFRAGSLLVMLRVPRFRFRPGHADGLHLDLWWRGRNILRDSGSYSYAELAKHLYFSGVAAHNTVAFDGLEQMPRLSRFLFGDWIEASSTAVTDLGSTGVVLSGSLRTASSATHKRTVEVNLDLRRIDVIDEVAGFEKEALLRWRLPGEASAERSFESEGFTLEIDGVTPDDISNESGEESRFYLESNAVSVIVARRRKSGQFRTRIQLIGVGE